MEGEGSPGYIHHWSPHDPEHQDLPASKQNFTVQWIWILYIGTLAKNQFLNIKNQERAWKLRKKRLTWRVWQSQSFNCFASREWKFLPTCRTTAGADSKIHDKNAESERPVSFFRSTAFRGVGNHYCLHIFLQNMTKRHLQKAISRKTGTFSILQQQWQMLWIQTVPPIVGSSKHTRSRSVRTDLQMITVSFIKVMCKENLTPVMKINSFRSLTVETGHIYFGPWYSKTSLQKHHYKSPLLQTSAMWLLVSEIAFWGAGCWRNFVSTSWWRSPSNICQTLSLFFIHVLHKQPPFFFQGQSMDPYFRRHTQTQTTWLCTNSFRVLRKKHWSLMSCKVFQMTCFISTPKCREKAKWLGHCTPSDVSTKPSWPCLRCPAIYPFFLGVNGTWTFSPIWGRMWAILFSTCHKLWWIGPIKIQCTPKMSVTNAVLLVYPWGHP